MVAEVDPSVEGRCLDIDIEDIAQIQFEGLGPRPLKELPYLCSTGHPHLNIDVEAKRFCRPFGRIDRPKLLVQFGLRMLLVIIHQEKGEIAGPLKELVEHKDILEETVGAQLFFHLSYAGYKDGSVRRERQRSQVYGR